MKGLSLRIILWMLGLFSLAVAQGPNVTFTCAFAFKCTCALGLSCEKCPTCPDRCDEFAPCVQCVMFKTGIYADENVCKKECGEKYPQIEEVDVAATYENLDEKCCHYINESDKCRFYYVYGYDRNGKLYLKSQKSKDCLPDPPIFWILFGVVGAIVFMGIAILLAWKCATYIADRREYASFEKERIIGHRWIDR